MGSPSQSKLVSGLAVLGLVCLVGAYFVPVWWVSLTAPNYPPDAFPDGIRIHFTLSDVENGCKSAPKTSRAAQETIQGELGWRDEEGNVTEETSGDSSTLDCVHEMNTINHYVGMHAIGFGAPVELSLSRYIIAMFAVMLAGFAIAAVRARIVVLAAGFAAVTGWMLVDLFALGRFGEIIATFRKEVAIYFNEAERIAAWGANLQTWLIATVIVLVGAMAFSVWATTRWPRFQLVLGLIPALMPVFFLASYAGWLYYFGHNLHPWGAFTVKPFMPTVLGDGKVAQFTTHSYPHIGFFFIVAASVVMVVALARRRLEFVEGSSAAPAAMPPHEAGATAS
jgi:hypothetical protein